MEMTAKKLKELCRKDSLYSTPYLNDKLYLHYKGFRRIESLGEYTGLRVLWLEGNGLGAIEGLEAQTELRTLYLQENLVERIEGLAHMSQLVTLNLCKNLLRELPAEPLAALPALQTLMVAHNHLPSAAACEGLRACRNVTTLDLQENRIEDPEIVDVLADMPQLAVLYLQGNPCVKKIRHYRKHVVGRLKGLKYLDDRPVFDDERRRCDVWYAAWVAGAPEGAAAGGGAGYDDAGAMAAERAEMERQRVEKIATEERNFNAFADFVRRSAEERVRAPPAPGEAPFELEAQDESNLPEIEGGAGGGADEDEGEDEAEEEEEDVAGGTDIMSAAIRAFSRPTGAAVAPPAVPPAAPRRAAAAASAGASNAAAVAAGGATDTGGSSDAAAVPAPAPALAPAAPPAPPAPSSATLKAFARPSLPEAYAQASDPARAVNPFSGEPIVPTVESAEARAYREERWQRIVSASENFRSAGTGTGSAAPPLPVSPSMVMPAQAQAQAQTAVQAQGPAQAQAQSAAATLTPAGEPEAANGEEQELRAAERAAAGDAVAFAEAATASALAVRLALARERAAALAPPPSAPSAAAREAGDFLRLLREETGAGAGADAGADALLAPAEHEWQVVEGAPEAPTAAAVAAPAAAPPAESGALSPSAPETPALPSAPEPSPASCVVTDLEDVD